MIGDNFFGQPRIDWSTPDPEKPAGLEELEGMLAHGPSAKVVGLKEPLLVFPHEKSALRDHPCNGAESFVGVGG